MTRLSVHRWRWVHKWSSVVCTAFLLVICLTGLPLVFHEEIDHWLDDDPPYAVLPAATPAASLDRIAQSSRQLYPGQVIVSMFTDDDEPQVIVTLATSWADYNADPRTGHWIKFDARTAEVLEQSKPAGEDSQTFMGVMLRLHMDLFAGLPGQLFMAAMALLFVIAIISGVVLYAPFMRKLDFGTVRADRSPRLKWLDLHNLLGVVTLAWALVVGATGVINELSTPLFALWQRTDVKVMLDRWQGAPIASPAELSSVQAALETARAATPGMTVISVVYPGSAFGTSYHYLFWAKGQTPLTSRLFSPVLVDARSGALVGAVAMPWYLRALEISRPLHFGDYGGLPLKIIWALLDLVTIVVLGSGLYLWLGRRASSPATAGQGDTVLAPAHPGEAAE